MEADRTGGAGGVCNTLAGPVANTYASQAWKLKYELAEWNLKEHYHTICNMQLFVDYYTASEECLRVELHNTKAHVTHLRKLEWRYMNEMFGLKQAIAGLKEKLIISEAQRAAGEIALKTALDQVEKLQDGATVTPAFNKTILGTWQITPPSSPVKIHFPSPASEED